MAVPRRRKQTGNSILSNRAVSRAGRLKAPILGNANGGSTLYDVNALRTGIKVLPSIAKDSQFVHIMQSSLSKPCPRSCRATQCRRTSLNKISERLNSGMHPKSATQTWRKNSNLSDRSRASSCGYPSSWNTDTGKEDIPIDEYVLNYPKLIDSCVQCKIKGKKKERPKKVPEPSLCVAQTQTGSSEILAESNSCSLLLDNEQNLPESTIVDMDKLLGDMGEYLNCPSTDPVNVLRQRAYSGEEAETQSTRKKSSCCCLCGRVSSGKSIRHKCNNETCPNKSKCNNETCPNKSKCNNETCPNKSKFTKNNGGYTPSESSKCSVATEKPSERFSRIEKISLPPSSANRRSKDSKTSQKSSTRNQANVDAQSTCPRAELCQGNKCRILNEPNKIEERDLYSMKPKWASRSKSPSDNEENTQKILCRRNVGFSSNRICKKLPYDTDKEPSEICKSRPCRCGQVDTAKRQQKNSSPNGSCAEKSELDEEICSCECPHCMKMSKDIPKKSKRREPDRNLYSDDNSRFQDESEFMDDSCYCNCPSCQKKAKSANRQLERSRTPVSKSSGPELNSSKKSSSEYSSRNKDMTSKRKSNFTGSQQPDSDTCYCDCPGCKKRSRETPKEYKRQEKQNDWICKCKCPVCVRLRTEAKKSSEWENDAVLRSNSKASKTEDDNERNKIWCNCNCPRCRKALMDTSSGRDQTQPSENSRNSLTRKFNDNSVQVFCQCSPASTQTPQSVVKVRHLTQGVYNDREQDNQSGLSMTSICSCSKEAAKASDTSKRGIPKKESETNIRNGTSKVLQSKKTRNREVQCSCKCPNCGVELGNEDDKKNAKKTTRAPSPAQKKTIAPRKTTASKEQPKGSCAPTKIVKKEPKISNLREEPKSSKPVAPKREPKKEPRVPVETKSKGFCYSNQSNGKAADAREDPAVKCVWCKNEPYTKVESSRNQPKSTTDQAQIESKGKNKISREEPKTKASSYKNEPNPISQQFQQELRVKLNNIVATEISYEDVRNPNNTEIQSNISVEVSQSKVEILSDSSLKTEISYEDSNVEVVYFQNTSKTTANVSSGLSVVPEVRTNRSIGSKQSQNLEEAEYSPEVDDCSTCEQCTQSICDQCTITPGKRKSGEAMVNMVVDGKCDVNQIIEILHETVAELEQQKKLLSQTAAECIKTKEDSTKMQNFTGKANEITDFKTKAKPRNACPYASSCRPKNGQPTNLPKQPCLPLTNSNKLLSQSRRIAEKKRGANNSDHPETSKASNYYSNNLANRYPSNNNNKNNNNNINSPCCWLNKCESRKRSGSAYPDNPKRCPSLTYSEIKRKTLQKFKPTKSFYNLFDIALAIKKNRKFLKQKDQTYLPHLLCKETLLKSRDHYDYLANQNPKHLDVQNLHTSYERNILRIFKKKQQELKAKEACKSCCLSDVESLESVENCKCQFVEHRRKQHNHGKSKDSRRQREQSEQTDLSGYCSNSSRDSFACGLAFRREREERKKKSNCNTKSYRGHKEKSLNDRRECLCSSESRIRNLEKFLNRKCHEGETKPSRSKCFCKSDSNENINRKKVKELTPECYCDKDKTMVTNYKKKIYNWEETETSKDTDVKPYRDLKKKQKPSNLREYESSTVMFSCFCKRKPEKKESLRSTESKPSKESKHIKKSKSSNLFPCFHKTHKDHEHKEEQKPKKKPSEELKNDLKPKRKPSDVRPSTSNTNKEKKKEPKLEKKTSKNLEKPEKPKKEEKPKKPEQKPEPKPEQKPERKPSEELKKEHKPKEKKEQPQPEPKPPKNPEKPEKPKKNSPKLPSSFTMKKEEKPEDVVSKPYEELKQEQKHKTQHTESEEKLEDSPQPEEKPVKKDEKPVKYEQLVRDEQTVKDEQPVKDEKPVQEQKHKSSTVNYNRTHREMKEKTNIKIFQDYKQEPKTKQESSCCDPCKTRTKCDRTEYLRTIKKSSGCAHYTTRARWDRAAPSDCIILKSVEQLKVVKKPNISTHNCECDDKVKVLYESNYKFLKKSKDNINADCDCKCNSKNNDQINLPCESHNQFYSMLK